MLSNRFVALAIASLPFLAACIVERQPAQQPQPAPAPTTAPAPTEPPAAAAQPLACPVGVWHVGGPTGTTKVLVTAGSKPGTYDVKYEGSTGQPGNGQMTGNQFTYDMGASTGGLANCTMAADCQTMTCAVAGQPPQTFKKGGP